MISMMPSSLKPSTKLYGIELDGMTSTIAQTLYPKASMQNKGFQDRVTGHEIGFASFPGLGDLD